MVIIVIDWVIYDLCLVLINFTANVRCIVYNCNISDLGPLPPYDQACNCPAVTVVVSTALSLA